MATAEASKVDVEALQKRVTEKALSEGMDGSIQLAMVDSQSKKVKIGAKELTLTTGSFEGKNSATVWKYVFTRLGDEMALLEKIDEAGCEPELVENAKVQRLGRIGGRSIHAVRLELVKSSCVGAENDTRKEIDLLLVEEKAGLQKIAELPLSEAGRAVFKIEKSRILITGSMERSFEWDPKTKKFVER